MIYHFWRYLKDSFPSYNIVAEVRDPSDAREGIVVREGSGASDGWNLKRIDAAVQVVVRAKNAHTARTMAYAVFDLCREKYNFDLPAFATGETDLRIKHLKAIQPPYSAGQEASGMFVYVNNYLATFQDD